MIVDAAGSRLRSTIGPPGRIQRIHFSVKIADTCQGGRFCTGKTPLLSAIHRLLQMLKRLFVIPWRWQSTPRLFSKEA